MNKFKFTFTILLIISIATALYFYFMAPIDRCFSTGIPCTSYAYGKEIHNGKYELIANELIQGDHLQLQYHFDLFSKMIKGEIPAFHNLYEFNTGSDSERKIIDPYYIPFSLIYAIAQNFSSDAFAWNFSQLLSVLCSFVLIYLLVRRYADSKALQFTCIAMTVIAMCVPYRWVNLGAGSPTGFGMGLVPGVFLCIDITIRDKRFIGGIFAAILIFLLYCTDLHCFVFSVLATPGFCIVSWLYKANKPSDIIPTKEDCIYLIKNLIAIPIACLFTMIFALKLRASYASTDVAGGRTLEELVINSPMINSLVDYKYICHGSMHFNIGWMLTILIIISCIITIIALIYYYKKNNSLADKTDGQQSYFSKKLIIALTALLLCIAILTTIILALGTNGPIHGLALRAIRKLIPPYQMIRQPVKIFCLLPTLLAPLLILVWRFLDFKRAKYQQYVKGMILFAIVVVSLIIAKDGMWCGICLLPEKKQEAYQAVIKSATKLDKTPRALILPIWSGDSAWSSIYEYHAMRNNLRMLNGYSPVKSLDYLDDVFTPYSTLTQGIFTDKNRTQLIDKHSTTAIIIHENAFPDKVSPLPVGYTLKQFIKNSNLEFLKNDRDAWSFSLFPSSDKKNLKELIPQSYCPTRVWFFNKFSDGKGLYPKQLIEEEISPFLLYSPAADAQNGKTWLSFKDELKITSKSLDSSFLTNNYHRAGMWVVQTPEPNKISFISDGKEVQAIQLKDKFGVPLPLAATPIGTTSFSTNNFVALDINGDAPIHTVAYMPIIDILDPRGAPRTIAATDLSHAGYTSATIDKTTKTISLDYVVLEPEHAPGGKVVYGPNLPIIGGTWQAEIEFTEDSPKIGEISVCANGTEIAKGPVDKPLTFTAKNCEFICVYYNYPDIGQTVSIKAIEFSAK